MNLTKRITLACACFCRHRSQPQESPLGIEYDQRHSRDIERGDVPVEIADQVGRRHHAWAGAIPEDDGWRACGTHRKTRRRAQQRVIPPTDTYIWLYVMEMKSHTVAWTPLADTAPEARRE